MSVIYKYNNKMSVLTEEQINFELTFAIMVPKSITITYEDFMSDYLEGEDKEVKIRVWKSLIRKAQKNKYDEIDLGEAEHEEWSDRMDDMTPIQNHIEEVRDKVEEKMENEEKKEERIIVSKK